MCSYSITHVVDDILEHQLNNCSLHDICNQVSGLVSFVAQVLLFETTFSQYMQYILIHLT